MNISSQNGGTEEGRTSEPGLWWERQGGEEEGGIICGRDVSGPSSKGKHKRAREGNLLNFPFPCSD